MGLDNFKRLLLPYIPNFKKPPEFKISALFILKAKAFSIASIQFNSIQFIQIKLKCNTNNNKDPYFSI